MNIVIVGAGDIGLHIAGLVSQKGNSVFLIDKDKHKLQSATQNLDLAVKLGLATDWKLLNEIKQFSPDMLLAFTGNDEANLIACSIAKQLGYPVTLARVRSSNYINSSELDFSHLFHADQLLCPELLVAQDFFKTLVFPGALYVQNFVHGAVQMLTLKIPKNWKEANCSLKNLNLPKGVVVALIRRINKSSTYFFENLGDIIFPHGDDFLLPEDEVTFIGEASVMLNLHHFLGIKKEKMRSVVLVGGGLINYHLAQLLIQQGIHVRIIDKDYNRCKELSEKLPEAVIIHQNGMATDLYINERIEYADAFVAATRHDEVNFMSANLAVMSGCKKVMICLSNTKHTSLAQKMGISNVFSPRMSCENHVLAMISSAHVNSAFSFYNDQAEVLEIKISQGCKITGIPIAKMGKYLPKEFLFAVIQNRGKTVIANGQCMLTPGDTVIAITHPKHTSILRELF